MSVWDDIGDAFTDAVDWVTDTVEDFFNNPLDALGGYTEDLLTNMFTLGIGNRYDTSYWREKFRPDQQSPVFEDRLQTARNSIASREMVYGRVKKGGTVVYVESDGDNDEYLHMVVVLAAHSCEDIHGLYFNDDLVTSGSTGTTVKTMTATDADTLYAVCVLDAGATAPTEITNYAPSSWTSAHALTGCCYLYLRLTYDREMYRNGIPRITVELSGKNDIYDPRTATSGYTDTYSLCLLDYMRADDGMAIPDAEIDMQSFEDGADYDEQTLDTPEILNGFNLTESRYTVAGVISVDRAPLAHLEELRKSGGGLINYSQGLWRLIRAEYTAPVDSFDESDLIGGVSFSPASSKMGRVNTVRGVYIDRTTFERTEYPEFTVASYVTDDKETLSRNMDFNFVSSPYQCQRLAKIEIERSRYGLSLIAGLKFRAWKLQAGQRINLDIGVLGNKTFLVLDVGLSLDGGVAVQMQEDHADVYDWTTGEAKEVTAPPAVNLPNPNPVTPSNLAIAEELYSTNNGASIKTRVTISWDEPAGRTQEYELQFKKSADSTWIVVDGNFGGSAFVYDDFEPDTYDFRVRAVNNIGWVSGWLTSSSVVILGKTAPPPNVDALLFNNGVLEWTYEDAPIDLAGFEVRYADNTDATWEDAAVLHAGLVSYSKFYLGFTPANEAIFFVKAVDDSRNYSVDAAYATVAATASGTTQLVDITSERITRSGIITTKYVGAFTTDNYVTFLGDDTNDDKSPPQGTMSATDIFGNTLAQVVSFGGALWLCFTSMPDPNEIGAVEYRWNNSDPWQSVAIAGQTDYLSNRWRVSVSVGYSFQTQFEPENYGGVYLRISQATPDAVTVTLAAFTESSENYKGATTANHPYGANGTLSTTTVNGETLAGIYTKEDFLYVAFEGDTTAAPPFEKLFLTGQQTTGQSGGNRTMQRSKCVTPAGVYNVSDDVTYYTWEAGNGIPGGDDPYFTGAALDTETANFYS